MPATVTLATATLTYGIDSGASEVTLSDVSGVRPGYRLFIDRELLQAQSVSGSVVKVKRGIGGTANSKHDSSATVYIGRSDWFYQQDPVGAPEPAIPVSPYINVSNGKVFFAQGDATSTAYRWWEEAVTTYGTGPLGVRTRTSSLSAST